MESQAQATCVPTREAIDPASNGTLVGEEPRNSALVFGASSTNERAASGDNY